MSTKKIEYEEFKITGIADVPVQIHTGCGDRIVIQTIDDQDCCERAAFTDPAKLRTLATEINKAADALEASQRLTFGDLKPGEWFSWDGGDPHPGPPGACQKVSIDAYHCTTRTSMYLAQMCWPVLRITASFTESPPDARTKGGE